MSLNMGPTKTKSIEIILDEQEKVFHPGEEVKGKVYLRLTQDTTIKNILMAFYGEAKVQYRQGKYLNEMQLTYFEQSAVLYNRGADEQTQGKFVAGEYAYPFIFTLPEGVPSSHEDDLPSHVRYSLSVLVKRSWKFNLSAAARITVSEIVDVSKPELQLPITEQHDELVSCLCVISFGDIQINAKLNKRGYYPGETIEAKLYVGNRSNRDVTYTEMVLRKVILRRYGTVVKSQKPIVNSEKSTIASVKGRGTPRRHEESFDELKVEIPDFLPPSTGSETPTLITTKYYMNMIAHVKGSCVSAAKIRIPIEIGSYPPGFSGHAVQSGIRLPIYV